MNSPLEALNGHGSQDKKNAAVEALSSTLPASWYSTKSIFDLERRAIFSRHWLLVSHELRFGGIGSYASYTIAGFPVLIIRDREATLNAYLNVCRHRAFPVVLQDEGTANILHCKYHGWSYGLKGNLAKAPKFESLSSFDKDKYSLFRVHLKTDKRGFLWVNLDSAEQPEVRWEDSYAESDTNPRLEELPVSNYKYDHSWKVPGEYNWKAYVDNYNEDVLQCYHCSVAHPGVVATTNLDTYDVKTISRFIEHYSDALGTDNAGTVAPTYYFPNASYIITEHYFYLMRVVPINEHQTSMEYEVFRNKKTSDAIFLEIDKFFKQIEAEDRFLCTNAQKNLNSGGYVSGPLHPHNEKGVLYFKSLIKDTLIEHRGRERAKGEDINAASRRTDDHSTKEEEAFCQDLCAPSRSELAW